MKAIKEMLEKARFDEKHHLGLGDIRLTIGQQEMIEKLENALLIKIQELEIRLQNLRHRRDIAIMQLEGDMTQNEVEAEKENTDVDRHQ